MPVDFDIIDHEIFGPVIRESRREGATQIVRRQLEKRFGPLPEWAEQRLKETSQSQAEDLALRFLDAKSLEELFG